MRTRVAGAAAAVIVTAAIALTAAQPPQGKPKTPPKAAPPRARTLTTSSGIYTTQQAMRGEITYMNMCVSCHPPGWYSLPAFKEKWNGAPLSKLFDLVAGTMPKNEPGSLTDKEYADAIAFILRTNKAPAGQTELPADIAALRRITIALN